MCEAHGSLMEELLDVDAFPEFVEENPSKRGEYRAFYDGENVVADPAAAE